MVLESSQHRKERVVMSFGVAGSKFTRIIIHASTDGYEKGYRTGHMCTIATIDNRVYRGAFDYRGNISLARFQCFSFLCPSDRPDLSPSAHLAYRNPTPGGRIMQ